MLKSEWNEAHEAEYDKSFFISEEEHNEMKEYKEWCDINGIEYK